jgi:hypothetical protein
MGRPAAPAIADIRRRYKSLPASPGRPARANRGSPVPRIAIVLLTAVALTSPAAARRVEPVKTVFSCTVRGGAVVSITARGDSLTYRYGTPRRAELTITASPHSGNIRRLQQRYVGPEEQIRFIKGEYSYIVYSMGADPKLANSVSGLVVMRGTRRIADRPCTRYSEFKAGFDLLERLPQDSESWTAM